MILEINQRNDSILPLRLLAVAAVAAITIYVLLFSKANSQSPPSDLATPPASAPEENENVVESPPPLTTTSVALTQRDGKWTLLRNGEPYFVKGVGGDTHLAELAAAGGNSIRTWGIDEDDTKEILDRAHSHGITVTLGHWLGHKRHGFNYDNPTQVKKQLERVITATKKYKDHPALLAWGVGNETELEQWNNPNVWKAIEEAAAAIKKIDPNHPTICVIAELGADNSNLTNIAQHCPSIDIVGINTYDGALSVMDRFAKSNLGLPCILTEYGPRLPGDLKTEPTSTEKAEIYREIYTKTIASHPLSLGGYSFLWGAKEEGSDTYFGQLLSTGERLAQAEVYHELFDGEPPANRVPQCEPLQFSNPSMTVKVGAPLFVSWVVTDPENDPLTYRWELKRELAASMGGDKVATQQNISSALTTTASGQVTLEHTDPGTYRLYAYAFDDHSNAATASARVIIRPDVALQPSPKAPLPHTLYEDAHFAPQFHPSGYQGPVTDSIKVVTNHTENPHSGESCLKITSSALSNWIGVSLQSPANDWGAEPGGLNFTGATKLSFWAKGETGKETVTFGFGNIPKDQIYFDTTILETPLRLTNDWTLYTIDLSGHDLSRIKTPLFIGANTLDNWGKTTDKNALAFYLDRIVIQ